MSNEKQQLYDKLLMLPDELVEQVINYMEFLKFSNIKLDGPKSIKINNNDDLIKELDKGMKGIENGDICSLEEIFDDLDKI